MISLTFKIQWLIPLQRAAAAKVSPSPATRVSASASASAKVLSAALADAATAAEERDAAFADLDSALDAATVATDAADALQAELLGVECERDLLRKRVEEQRRALGVVDEELADFDERVAAEVARASGGPYVARLRRELRVCTL